MRGRYTICLLVSLISLLFFAFPISLEAKAPESVRIEGVVRDLTSGTPVPPIGSVDIIINGWMVVHSGRDGEWNITGLKPGEYTVELGLPRGSYTPGQDIITVGLWTPGTVEQVELNFYQGAAPVGSFTSADNVAPLIPNVPGQAAAAGDGDALVAPPLVTNQAQAETPKADETEAVVQDPALTPPLEPVLTQTEVAETTSQAMTDQSVEGGEEVQSTGEAIPGLGGAGPEEAPFYDHVKYLSQIVGSLVMVIGLIFLISGLKAEGSRNLE